MIRVPGATDPEVWVCPVTATANRGGGGANLLAMRNRTTEARRYGERYL